MRLHLRGAVRNVTGSCYIVETPMGLLMVDCGLYQGSRKLEERNWRKFEVAPSAIRWVVLTHAHIDHIGLIPRLVAEGYEGDLIAHTATCDLADIMLRDAGHIQEEDAAWALERWKRSGRKVKAPRGPLYTVADAERVVTHLRGISYNEIIDLAPGVRIRLRDAGHILGSAHLELWLHDTRQWLHITFSSDIGSGESQIVRAPQPPSRTDFLVIESTYGDRNHEPATERNEKLRRLLFQTLKQGGCVVIPAFSVGRTQELLYALNEMEQTHTLPVCQTFVDSPLAISATRIFQKHPECYKRELLEDILKGDDPFDFPGLQFSRTVEESKRINSISPPYIVISAAGMCNAGRIRHHLLNHLGNPRDLVLFVGYQAENTLGRLIRDGHSPIRILGQLVHVRAKVAELDGFSAHADREGLLHWFSSLLEPPAFTFVTHGELQASFALRDALHKEFSARALVPELGAVVDLCVDNGALIQQVQEQENRSGRLALTGEPSSRTDPQEAEEE
ncbi:MAG: MBL fold metallo-hydrolase RNA specificity domain-containing protein [Candidatus Zipacnadales bacterium]